TFDAGGRRLALATQLRRHAAVYTPSGRRWLGRAAERLLQDGTTSAAGEKRLIALCDELIAISRRRSEVLDIATPSRAAAPNPSADRAFAGRQPAIDGGAIAAAPTPPAADTTDETAQDPATTSGGSDYAIEVIDPADPGDSTGAIDPIDRGEPRTLVRGPTPSRPREPGPVTLPASPRPLPTDGAPDALAWGRRPPALTATGPSSSARLAAPRDVFSGWQAAHLAIPFVDDHALITVALAADEPLVRAELVSRGFAEASRRELSAAVAADPMRRRSLVDRLLVSGTGGALRLLLMLAGDADPTVREAAISALGATGDQRLRDAAWRMAVRDPDPRVARLADLIRRADQTRR
ncbi:MAG: hypothetical protein AAF790_09535, partial [Planctomycetota bacterium]